LDTGIPDFLRMDDDIGTEIAPAKTDIRLHLGIDGPRRYLLSNLVHQLFRAAALAIDVLADKASLFHLLTPFPYLLTQKSAQMQHPDSFGVHPANAVRPDSVLTRTPAMKYLCRDLKGGNQEIRLHREFDLRFADSLTLLRRQV
jgi:hypothetical protein